MNMTDTSRFSFAEGLETAQNKCQRSQAVEFKNFQNLLEEEKSCAPRTSVNNRPFIGKAITRNSQDNQAIFEKKEKARLHTFIYESFHQNRHLLMPQEGHFRANEPKIKSSNRHEYEMMACSFSFLQSKF